MRSYTRPTDTDDDIPALTQVLAHATAAVADALRAASGNQDDRDVKNAEFVRRHAERQLAAAQHREDERERVAKLTPAEIVDRAMGR